MRNEMPPMPGEEMPGSELPTMGSEKEICFPKSALALSGEGNEETMPEDGETVTIEVSGKVRIEGDKAYLTPETANGEKVMGDKPDEAEPGDDKASLEEMAKQLDAEG
jgi:hypothetical protein